MIPVYSIQAIAQRVGFDACGVSPASNLVDDKNRLTDWLRAGMHGEMEYMTRNLHKRCDPGLLVPNAKAVISVLLNYYPGDTNLSITPPKISRYAQGFDYHAVVKKMLWGMLELLREENPDISGRAFVDSAPVLERAWAVNSGLGWIGKNGMLINPKLGSYVFIGELVVDVDVEPSRKMVPNRCGSCTRCIDACPTGAIIAPKIIDSRKCISYLTIEKKSALTDLEKQSLNGWCFGCDICQEVCPWNRKVKVAQCESILAKPEVNSMDLFHLNSISEMEFDTIFGDTPVSRAGFTRFKQNIEEAKGV